MSDFIFNAALGKDAYYAGLPAANDALIVVLLKATGLEADSVLGDYDDLDALLAAANDECDFTNYARKTLTSGVTVTVDDTNARVGIDYTSDLTWTSAGGATNNTIGKLLVCYDPDTTGGTDSSIIPLYAYDYSETTTGSTLIVTVNATGLARTSAV